MTPGLTALFVRTLREDARKVSLHLLRLVLVIGLIVTIGLIQARPTSFGAPGLALFAGVVWANVMALFLLGGSYLSSVIAEEKEGETLGLLVMSGVSPPALLLGKMASRWISVVLMLSVQLPLVLLAVTMGGVTLKQIFAAYLALGLCSLLVASLSLLCSVWCPTETAANLMVICLFPAICGSVNGFGFIKFVIYGFGSPPLMWKRGMDLLSWIDVGPRLVEILSPTFAGPLWHPQLLVHLALTMVCCGLSWWLLLYHVHSSEGGARRRDARARRAGRVWTETPLLWKDLSFTAGGVKNCWRRFWYCTLGLGIILVNCVARSMEPGSKAFGTIVVLFLATCVWGIVTTIAAYSQAFADDVTHGTLSTLQLTPLGWRRLLRQRRWGIYARIAPAVAMTLISWLAMAVSARNDKMRDFGWYIWASMTGTYLLAVLTVLVELRWKVRVYPAVATFECLMIGCLIFFKPVSRLFPFWKTDRMIVLGLAFWVSGLVAARFFAAALRYAAARE